MYCTGVKTVLPAMRLFNVSNAESDILHWLLFTRSFIVTFISSGGNHAILIGTNKFLLTKELPSTQRFIPQREINKTLPETTHVFIAHSFQLRFKGFKGRCSKLSGVSPQTVLQTAARTHLLFVVKNESPVDLALCQNANCTPATRQVHRLHSRV